MRRRHFITLLGGAAAALPLAVRAQQPAKPAVGFLSSLSPGELTFVMPAFHQGLKRVGLRRWSEHCDRIPLGAWPLRAIAGVGRRSGEPASCGGRRDQRYPGSAGGEGGDDDDSDCVRDWR